MFSSLLFVLITLVATGVGRQIHVERMLRNIHKHQDTYLVPRLSYRYEEYEPWLDADTIGKHYQVLIERTQQMNRLLKELKASNSTPALSKSSLFAILRNINKVPEEWRDDLGNSIGGYLNHIFYFAVLTPNPSGKETNATTDLSTLMKRLFWRSFSNLETFQERFNETALGMFSSGYVWMCRDPKKRYIAILSGMGEFNPLSRGLQPLLGIDLWEHAYWSKYQNNRESYIRNWWKLVDYAKIENVLDWWWSMDPYDPQFDPKVNDVYSSILEPRGSQGLQNNL